MPYSDPMMDGVTIQRAGTEALQRGVRTRDAFAAVEAVASRGVPAVVMTYWNLVERYGADRFARDLVSAGGAGAITPTSLRTRRRSGSQSPTRTIWTGSSWSRPHLPKSGSPRPWQPAAAGSTRPRLMGVTGARAQTSAAAPELVRRMRRSMDPSAMVGVGLGRIQWRAGSRGDRFR